MDIIGCYLRRHDDARVSWVRPNVGRVVSFSNMQNHGKGVFLDFW
jgi:hypothetical protein